ncbi:MAG: hypothetical protein WB402_04145 [Sulfuricaulis sp.]|uniref:hypothetical protein n=1 Tax=Sulfuricaulis sp. TaxID=2003553 RepID=UPI003C58FAAC
MNTTRQVLILYLGSDMPAGLMEMADMLVRLGAIVNVRMCGGRYDEILDDVAAVDTVICWR